MIPQSTEPGVFRPTARAWLYRELIRGREHQIVVHDRWARIGFDCEEMGRRVGDRLGARRQEFGMWDVSRVEAQHFFMST